MHAAPFDALEFIDGVAKSHDSLANLATWSKIDAAKTISLTPAFSEQSFFEDPSREPKHSARRETLPMFSCEVQLALKGNSASEIASNLARIALAWFEIFVPATADRMGERFCFAPVLGFFHSALDEFGNQVFRENQIQAILQRSSGQAASRVLSRVPQSAYEQTDIAGQLAIMLGEPWDSQFEHFRKAKSELDWRLSRAS